MHEKESGRSHGDGFSLISDWRGIILRTKHLARTRKDLFQWHYTQRAIHHSVTADCRTWHELADGSWLQETQPGQAANGKLPAVWISQKKRWQHLLGQLAVTDFQLHYSQTRAFLLEPRTQALPIQHDWRFSWTLPSRGLGPLLGSMSFRQSRPPSDFVANYLAQVSRVPVLGKTVPPQADIFFDARLLLHFLGNSIHHMERHGMEKGQWQHLPQKETLPAEPVEPFTAETEALPQPMTSPLLPREAAFYPTQTVAQRPRNTWEALHYDSDQKVLICRLRQDGIDVFGKWQLPKALYRYFPEFLFLGNRRNLVIQKCLTSLPDAVLPVHTLEKT